MKERLGMTDMRKMANRMNFAEASRKGFIGLCTRLD